MDYERRPLVRLSVGATVHVLTDGEVNVRQGDKTLLNDFIRGQDNNNNTFNLYA